MCALARRKRPAYIWQVMGSPCQVALLLYRAVSTSISSTVIATHLQGLREPLRVPFQRVQGRVEDARRDRRVHQLVDAHLAEHRQGAAQGWIRQLDKSLNACHYCSRREDVGPL